MLKIIDLGPHKFTPDQACQIMWQDHVKRGRHEAVEGWNEFAAGGSLKGNMVEGEAKRHAVHIDPALAHLDLN
jgi:hypothetical protein